MTLQDVERSTQLSKEQKVAEASRQFEALLLRQILSEAQKSTSSNAGEGSSVHGIYKDMVTAQLADKISHSRALGIAEVFQKQLNEQGKHQPKETI